MHNTIYEDKDVKRKLAKINDEKNGIDPATQNINYFYQFMNQSVMESK